MTSPTPYNAHPKAMINRTKFHACIFSSFGKAKANERTNRTLLYNIDYRHVKSIVYAINYDLTAKTPIQIEAIYLKNILE